MREALLLSSNYIIYLILAFLLTAMQSSLWLQVFGFAPAPYLWIPVLNYWTMSRSPYQAVVLHYLIAFVIASMSGIPLAMVFSLVLSIFTVTFLLKDRVLWSGSNSFVLAAGISALVVPVAVLICSQVIEERPFRDFYFYEWIMRALLTATFSFPLYYVFYWLDKMTRQEPPKHAESEVL